MRYPIYEAVCYLCTKITSQAIMSGSIDTLRSCSTAGMRMGGPQTIVWTSMHARSESVRKEIWVTLQQFNQRVIYGNKQQLRHVHPNTCDVWWRDVETNYGDRTNAGQTCADNNLKRKIDRANGYLARTEEQLHRAVARRLLESIARLLSLQPMLCRR